MRGFDPRFKNLPDYIIGVTKEIWEDRGVSKLDQYYARDIAVRSPMGVQRGNQSVKATTMATLHEFPDRQLYGEDVIWCGNEETGYLSSHRLMTTGTQLNDGYFGKATGRQYQVRIIADCAVRDNTIYDEWLVRDLGGMVRQLGMQPRCFAHNLIKLEGGSARCARPFTPDQDVDGGYHGQGNNNEWGAKYADILRRLMSRDFGLIAQEYDRAVIGDYAGGQRVLSHAGVDAFWLGLRSSFPDATFAIHHQIGMEGGMLSPRASVRWSLDGKHSGFGVFGEPSGADVHVMGISQAEFGPRGLRHEYALYDEIAIWKQILMQTAE